jgi:CRISPR system Cascade subunit CasA
MHAENRFNLVDEPWLPIVDHGLVSLSQVFSNPALVAIGGNPVQKVAVLKLLLAVAQAAITPVDEAEWRELGINGLSEKCLEYLDRWHERFYLYGEKPFLQMPAISAAKQQRFGAVLPHISTGNTTVLNQSQVERSLENADKAMLIVCLMGFALSGKKTDNRVTLTPGYAGKTNAKGNASSSKPGPSIDYLGLLHSFVTGISLCETLWLNLLSREQIEQLKVFPIGLGDPPWEVMPVGEDCGVARRLRGSLMGRLIPVCRFCLLEETGIHYSEGLSHDNYKAGISDPTAAINYAGRVPKAIWVNPERRPWRELTALLSFLDQENANGFNNLMLRIGLDRSRDVAEAIAVWSGGIRVSSNAGEQFVSGTDDYVESLVWLPTSNLGTLWFAQLKAEMADLDGLEKVLYGRVLGYFKELKSDASKLAAQATNLFWQLCERDFQALVDSCGQDETSVSQRNKLRRGLAGYVHTAYDRHCPRETARQLDAWAKCRPDNLKYLSKGT